MDIIGLEWCEESLDMKIMMVDSALCVGGDLSSPVNFEIINLWICEIMQILVKCMFCFD